MLRKAIMTVGILLLGLSLTACRKQDSQDLLKEKTDHSQMIATSSPQPQAAKASGSEAQKTAGQNTDTQLTEKTSDSAESDHNAITKGDAMEANGQNSSEDFCYEKLSDQVINRIKGKSYGDQCDVPYHELRYVRVLYWGFDDESHKGELIVNKDIAEDIVEIFKELYEEKYPIERMVLVDEYAADDNASMAADNTSAFNYRKVDGTEHLSLHSYGLAIDINPRYNPYVRTINKKTVVLPKNGSEYADRTLDCSYYIDKEDACYKAFIKHGFTWGGDWQNSKDYQHFQKERG